jgi:hypothetical protein
MVDSTDPSTWVYDPRYDNVKRWYKADMKQLDPSFDGTFPDKQFTPVVTSSFDAWKRSLYSPNVGLIAHCQKFFVHDSAEARVDDDGQMQVTCTCGLIVPINMLGDERGDQPGRPWFRFFAENHPTVSIAKQREFFEHPGHRDPFHNTVLGGFLARLREPGPEQYVFLEPRCVTCGWIEITYTLLGDWDAFDQYAHRPSIDMHNIHCPQPETDFWDGDMYLWGHGPGSAYQARRARREREAAERTSVDDEKDAGDSDPA